MGYLFLTAVVLFLILFFIVGIVVSTLAFFVGFFSPKHKDGINGAYVRFGLRGVLLFSGCSLEVIGREHIPAEAALFVGNHRSMFDIVALGPILSPPIGFIAKAELEKVPLLNGWMDRIHCLFLDRSDIKKGMQMILDATELLKRGISLFIFPEGTRNTTKDALLPFHAGSFKMAFKAGTPIVPVVINGTKDVFEDHIPRIDRRKIRVEFGEPVYTKDMDRAGQKALPEKIRAWIEEKYLAHEEE